MKRFTSIFHLKVAYLFSKNISMDPIYCSLEIPFQSNSFLCFHVLTNRLRWWRHIFELTTCLLITTRLASLVLLSQISKGTYV